MADRRDRVERVKVSSRKCSCHSELLGSSPGGAGPVRWDGDLSHPASRTPPSYSLDSVGAGSAKVPRSSFGLATACTAESLALCVEAPVTGKSFIDSFSDVC